MVVSPAMAPRFLSELGQIPDTGAASQAVEGLPAGETQLTPREMEILRLVARGMSNAELAERIGLSANACWRRTKRLQDSHVIRKRVALLSQGKLNLDVTVFVGIKTNEHNEQWLTTFAEVIKKIPEVV